MNSRIDEDSYDRAVWASLFSVTPGILAGKPFLPEYGGEIESLQTGYPTISVTGIRSSTGKTRLTILWKR